MSRFHSFNTLLSTDTLFCSHGQVGARGNDTSAGGAVQIFIPSTIPLNPDLRFRLYLRVFRRHACSLRCWTSSLWMRRSSRTTRLPAGGRFVGFATRGMCFRCLCICPPPFSLVVLGVVWCLYVGLPAGTRFTRATTHVVHFRSYPMHDNSGPRRYDITHVPFPRLAPRTDVAPVSIPLPITSHCLIINSVYFILFPSSYPYCRE